REEPIFASFLGDRRYNRAWGDGSLAGLAASHEKDEAALAALDAISVESLSEADRVHLAIAKRSFRDRVREFDLGWHLQPVSHRGGVQTLNTLAQRMRFESAQDYADWLARLKKIDRVVEQTIEVMNAGMERGIVRPRVIMERVPRQVALQVVTDPEQSPFWKTFEQIPERIAERDALQSEARDVIENVVIPAYRRFNTYLTRTYMPACRDTVGASALPDGTAWYDHAVARFTTTTLSADEIHQIGLDEVARIRGEMLDVMKEVNFRGDFESFKTFLRTDPQFFYETPEALLEGYLAMSKRLDPELVKLFGKLPRTPYGVKAIPDAIAPDTTTAYYSPPAADGSTPGYFWVNLYDVKSRPKWEMAALSVHEAVPGHHLQIALAMELEDVPEFRKHYWVTAFG
ncbi:MAG: DUF885 domain-containing protein, partial [Myxococcota bacterium]